MGNFKNKYVLITGGSYGIGAGIAEAFSKEGAIVGIISRNGAKSNFLKSNPLNFSLQCDVLNQDEVEETLKTIESKWEGIDILINNVGGGGQRIKKQVYEVPLSYWQEVFNKNVSTAIQFTNWAIPLMQKKSWGRVISISSVNGKESGSQAWYTISKAALIAFMASYSKEQDIVNNGITFNTVVSGPVAFEGNSWDEFKKENPLEYSLKIKQKIPVGRVGTVDDISNAVLHLANPKSSWINGSCHTIDGGQSHSF